MELILRLSMRSLARHPEAGRLVRMMLFRGLDAHWTNRSREKPHSKSGTLTKTACVHRGDIYNVNVTLYTKNSNRRYNYECRQGFLQDFSVGGEEVRGSVLHEYAAHMC